MSDNPKDTSTTPSAQDGQPAKPADAAKSSGRRRFLKGTVAAAPIVMTVASRPVWGMNCSLSGQLSGNLSDQAGQCSGEGCSPGYWKNNPSMWHPNYSQYAIFNRVFQCNAFDRDYTLLQVITYACDGNKDILNHLNCTYGGHNPNTQKNYRKAVMQLAFQCIAGLQNAATPVKYPMTDLEVIAHFKSAYTSSYGGCQKDTITNAKNYIEPLNQYGSPYCTGNPGGSCGGYK